MGHALRRRSLAAHGFLARTARTFVALAVVLGALWVTPALAQDANFEIDVDAAEAPRAPSPEDDRRARELFVLGDRLYEEGRYEASVTAFAEAYRLSGRPLLLFNLANAEERLGRLDVAAGHLRAYLPHAPADERVVVSARIRSIEARAAAAHAAEDHGAQDGQHVVEPPPPPPPPPPVHDGSRTLRRAGLATLVTGAVLVGTGAVFGVLANGARDDARSDCASVDGGRYCTAAARSSLDADRRDSLLADVSIGIGLAAVTTGLVLWLRGRRGSSVDAESDAPDARSCLIPDARVDAHGAEVSIHGRF